MSTNERTEGRFDGRAFRRCLGQYATGVAIITASHGSSKLGMTVNSFAALSLDPPLVLWSIRRESGRFEGFLAADHFAVNILAADQVEVSQTFASPGEDRFDLQSWTVGIGGAYLLEGAAAHLECRAVQSYDGGDHVILIGEVERFANHGREGLIFSQGRYAVASDHPKIEPRAVTEIPARNGTELTESVMRQLRRTVEALDRQFEHLRASQGLTVAQARIVMLLRAGAARIEELSDRALLGLEETSDAAAELVGRALIQQTRPIDLLELTDAGIVFADSFAQHVADFESQNFGKNTSDDMKAFRRVLSGIIG
jgi:flavin reductase (DIM6/NTAB) family NADH-FMN oxidoreductase RutF